MIRGLGRDCVHAAAGRIRDVQRRDGSNHPVIGVAQVRAAPVCTENSVRIDLMTESPNVRDDGRAIMLLPDAVHLAVQVEEPT